MIQWAKIILSYLIVAVVLYIYTDISRKLTTPADEKPLTIDSSIVLKQIQLIRENDSILHINDSILRHKQIIREQIPARVAHYTNSDLIQWADSFARQYGLPSSAYIQKDDRGN